MINDTIKQLQFVSNTIIELLQQVDHELLHKRPIADKMSIWEACVHLSQIPGADLHIQKKYSKQQMAEYYQTHRPDTIENVIAHFLEGIQELIFYYKELSKEELERQFKTYWGSEYSMAEWFIQIINHLVHHRSQLYQYLLLLNRDVQIVLFR
ncbi:DinB family protein [Psychrobacillus glaciei]|uniref:DinB family protein n=1 Tax=Psychrobacillus glaciei TaxID=2283160 RepID=A0A5J6SSQ1_9BACI|nr:DinB family protein [Psychrobacillus glaciei]QFG00600.1 DinB family protein [Psychrobacillus glaciei]